MVCKNIIDKTKLNMQSLSSTKKLAITNLSTIHWKKNVILNILKYSFIKMFDFRIRDQGKKNLPPLWEFF